MYISKSFPTPGLVTEADLLLINAHTRRQLCADDVYCFTVRLCDNDIDRDGERFDDAALDTLAALFVGKTGIFDHDWTAHAQTARIYRTEVVDSDAVNCIGEPLRYLKGYAYMLREGNDGLIAEIDGGIKREVSVGCSVKRRVCSECGADAGTCQHKRGTVYDGRLCHVVLCEVTDAYEWSFVAVPAQRNAGVTRKNRKEVKNVNMPLSELIKKAGSAAAAEYETLMTEAALSRTDTDRARSEAKRLAISVGLGEELSDAITKSLDAVEIRACAAALRRLASERYPAVSQFYVGSDDDGVYVV